MSVVIVSPFPQTSLVNCLDSVFGNENPGAVEIIAVVSGAAENTILDLIEKYPGVRFLRFSAETGTAALSAAGIAESSGEIIALTDSCCVVDRNWIGATFKAHQSPSKVVVGGAVEAFEKLKSQDWAAYFFDYGQFMLPLEAGTADVLPGNNISFKRSALTVGREYVEPEFWKTFWCRKLRAAGVELFCEPSIVVRQSRSFRFPSFLFQRFHQGRCFAGMRIEELSLVRRAIYLGGAVFLPFIIFYRKLTAVFAKKRLLKELLISMPFVVLIVIAWSLGEACGYFAGTGKSRE